MTYDSALQRNGRFYNTRMLFDHVKEDEIKINNIVRVIAFNLIFSNTVIVFKFELVKSSQTDIPA